LIVPAKGTAQFEVAYTPKTMTKMITVKKTENEVETEVEEM